MIDSLLLLLPWSPEEFRWYTCVTIVQVVLWIGFCLWLFWSL